MGTRDAPRLFRAAAQLIEHALIQLDLHHELCPTCTATRYRQIEHKRIYDRFSDTPLRLAEAAEAIEDPAAAAAKRHFGHELEQGLKKARRAATKQHVAGNRTREVS